MMLTTRNVSIPFSSFFCPIESFITSITIERPKGKHFLPYGQKKGPLETLQRAKQVKGGLLPEDYGSPPAAAAAAHLHSASMVPDFSPVLGLFHVPEKQ